MAFMKGGPIISLTAMIALTLEGQLRSTTSEWSIYNTATELVFMWIWVQLEVNPYLV